MSRPPIDPKKRRVHVGYRVKPKTKQAIEDEATTHDISQGIVIDRLAAGLGKKPRKGKA